MLRGRPAEHGRGGRVLLVAVTVGLLSAQLTSGHHVLGAADVLLPALLAATLGSGSRC